MCSKEIVVMVTVFLWCLCHGLYAQNPPTTPVPAPSSYFVAGGALGTPATFNVIGGYVFDKFAVRASFGSIFLNYSGFQVTGLMNVNRGAMFAHNVWAGIGFNNDSNHAVLDKPKGRWTYIGGGYELVWRQFFINAGLAFDLGKEIDLLAQIGYLYEFR